MRFEYHCIICLYLNLQRMDVQKDGQIDRQIDLISCGPCGLCLKSAPLLLFLRLRPR